MTEQRKCPKCHRPLGTGDSPGQPCIYCRGLTTEVRRDRVNMVPAERLAAATGAVDSLKLAVEVQATQLAALQAKNAKLKAEVGRMTPTFVPQAVLSDCLEFLVEAGMGKPGTPNTLWAMVKEAVAIVDKLPKNAEGVPVVDGDEVWFVFFGDIFSGKAMGLVASITWRSGLGREAAYHLLKAPVRLGVRTGYSTREAAAAAQSKGDTDD